MSNTADKARYYLERTVPDLREFERRNLFTAAEISSITRKRSDFEHVLNARGSTPEDYLRYFEYEVNLARLLRKRVQRKRQKKLTARPERRITHILERATRKHPGSLALWVQYIEYARSQGSSKKVANILTEALRMHPTCVELWVYAARYYAEEQGDISGARSAMQRGLRFCAGSKELYLEFARLEMEYLAKVVRRRVLLGGDDGGAEAAEQEEEKGEDEGLISLPKVTAADLEAEEDGGAAKMIQEAQEGAGSIYDTPAFTGAIPLAIFDAAMKRFSKDDELGERFFDMFADFTAIPTSASILQHTTAAMTSLHPTSPSTHSCLCKLPLAGVHYTSPEYPSAVRLMLQQLKTSSQEVSDKAAMEKRLAVSLKPVYGAKDLDPELREVLQSTIGGLATLDVP